MERLISDLKEGKPCLGLITKNEPWGMKAMAAAGFNYVIISRMFGVAGWGDIYTNVLAARQAGITPIVRLDAYPWGTDTPDRRLVVESGHAVYLGAGVTASVASAKEAELIAVPARDWHTVGLAPTNLKEMRQMEQDVSERAVVIPFVECISALEDLENIFSVEGIAAVRMSTTDLPRQLGHPLEPEHPDVWAYIDRAVEIGQRKNVAVMANTSYAATNVESIAQRIKNLWDHGVRIDRKSVV